jgi:hypothetical protein
MSFFQKFAQLALGLEGILVPVFVKNPKSQSLAAVFVMAEEDVISAFAPTAPAAPAPAAEAEVQAK